MHGNPLSFHPGSSEDYKFNRPLVWAGFFILFLGLLSFYLDIVAMWWRNTLSGTALAISSSIFSTLFLAVGQIPGSVGTYVDPDVLEACPGYVTRRITSSNGGSELRIDLGLPPGIKGCAIFGPDIEHLTVSVTHETGMLHSSLRFMLSIFGSYSPACQDHRRQRDAL